MSGRPPSWARTGRLASATATAVSAPTARDAGARRRRLLGLWSIIAGDIPHPFQSTTITRLGCDTGETRVVAGRGQLCRFEECRAPQMRQLRQQRGGSSLMLDNAKRLVMASARSDVPPFMVMDVMAAAARLQERGARVIHMEVGQPAAPAPTSAIVAAKAALEGRIAYTEALGIPSLRARLARHYPEIYRIEVDPARIIVTTGSSAAFILAFLALFEAGDRVAMAVPGYPPSRHIASALGCEVVPIETTAATRWALTGDALLAAHRKSPLKGVLVASPANPTGTMMTAQTFAELMRAPAAAPIPFI